MSTMTDVNRAEARKMVVREIHETMRHIAEVRRIVPAIFEGERYDMPAPDTTKTLCNKPINNGVVDEGEVGEHTDLSEVCEVCLKHHNAHINALYYGEDGE